jgi:hypothetical protein
MTAGLLVGCDSNDSDMEADPLRRVSYDLNAQPNDGTLSGGVSGTVTFWESGSSQTLVTLELDEGATGASVSHPAHIHENSASEGGDIAFHLSPIDGSGGGGTSARIINRPFDELSSFNGYVNVHESVANLSTVVAQGNIGSNADGREGPGLDLVENPRQKTYELSANSNSGTVLPGGAAGSVTVQEVNADQSLVSLSLNTGGSTGAGVSHPAHIHKNSVSEGGDIALYLSPIDGTDAAARSSKLVPRSYDELVTFDGYVNVHESVANLSTVVAQGNIGANADGSSDDGGDDDGGGSNPY